MSITESITRRVGDVDAALTNHGKAVLAQARKPAFAWLGASEYAVSHLTELPALTQAAARGVQQSLTSLPGGVPSVESVRAAVQSYGGQAVEAYDGLAQRGELVADRLRSRISGPTDEVTVAEAPAPAPAPAQKTTAPKTTARKTTAQKTTARKTAARKTAANATKAGRRTTTTRRSTAK